MAAHRLGEYATAFVYLSYPTSPPKNPDSFPDAQYFETGWRDVFFVITCIAAMAVLRDICRIFVFEPFARWKLLRDLAYLRVKKPHSNGSASHVANGKISANGNAKHTKKELKQLHHRVLRFAEQGWSFVYYTLQWTYGWYVNSQLPTRVLDPVDMWIGYPHVPLAGPLKVYYLTQTAFYCHQVLILNAEEHRKDHWQMMTHHFITVILMGLSYFFNFTRVGCLIMVLMDWCDIFLPLAKMLKYLDLPHQVYDSVFGCFLVSWFATRHVLFLNIVHSTVFKLPEYIPFEWAPEQGRFFSREYYLIFCGLLISLQIIQLFWFFTICRVAYNVLMKGEEASDVRSDEEGDDPEDEKKDQ